MSFATQFAESFAPQARSLGFIYYNQDRVVLDEMDAEAIWAFVNGDGEEYEVFVDLTDAREGVLNASCECPYFEKGSLCKHIWATLLEIEHDPDVAAILARSGYTLGGNGTPRAASAAAGAISDLIQRALGTGSKKLDGWHARMAEVLETNSDRQPLSHRPPLPSNDRIRMLLDVAECRDERGLIVRPLKITRRAKDGAFVEKPYRLVEWEVSRLASFETAQALLLLLKNDLQQQEDDYSSRYYGYRYNSGPESVTLSPVAFSVVLPELCKTGEFYWRLHKDQPFNQAVPIRWDDGAPYQLLLHGTDRPAEKSWRIEPRLVRPGEEPIDPADSVVLSLPELLLFADGRMCRADLGNQWGWVNLAFRSEKGLTVPYGDRDEFRRMLYCLPRLPRLDLPERLALPIQAGVPRPKLRFQARPHRDDWLQAFVTFFYGEDEINLLNMGECVGSGETVYRRDFDREQQLIDGLPDLGFQLANSNTESGAPFLLPRNRFMNAVSHLMESGWDVEAEEGALRRPGNYSLSVSTGVDWFDLESEFDFDGVSASLPELLKALREGQKFVKLDDGSQGLLPKEWLEKFEKFAGLGELQEDGQVRFKASQALLLDALLSAQENTKFDKGFADFRNKLSQFRGVKSRKEPRTFRGELREYQREGLGWLKFLQEFRFGGCLADDMGLGKTIQTLALLEDRRTRKLNDNEVRKPSLIVVPKSLVFNWIDESSRFTPNLKVINYTGLQRSETRDQFDEADVIVTTYGTLRKDIVELKDREFDYVILDEAQAIKNAASQSAKACRLLKAQHRLAMTGTPVENHLGELWSLFEFLNPGLLGQSQAFDRFSRAAPHDAEARELLQRAISPYLLRRTKQQVLSELPEKTEQTLYCDLPAKQKKEYEQLRDYYRALLSEKIGKQGLKRSKIHVLEALLRLRQAACHPGLIDKKRTGEMSAKLETLLEQITEIIDEGHKVLVFSQFTSLLSILREHLDRQKVTYECLTGRTHNRKARVERFQKDPDCKLFLISLKAGGHGLNLTAAEYVFILDPWWNPAVEAQAIDRAHRLGQERRVFAYRIIARGTVEEKVLELQQQKRELADAIINANDSLVRSLTAEDLQLLLS